MRLKEKYLILLSQLLLLLLLPLKKKNKPNVSNLVKKTDQSTKISEIVNKVTTDHDHDKHVATQEFNKLTAEHFTARLAQAKLAWKMILLILCKRQILIIN